MTAEETSAFGELISDMFYTHPRCEPVSLHIQKFHAAKLEDHLESGELEENFKCRIRKRLLDKIMMPSNKLMCTVDPKGSRKLNHVMRDLQPTSVRSLCFVSNILNATGPRLMVGPSRSTFRQMRTFMCSRA
jgi:hypothetical protein